MSEDETPIRLVVVDDHPVFRMGMVALLATVDHFEVVAEAASVDEAISTTTTNAPDVVLMDLQLGDGSGVEATRRIVEARTVEELEEWVAEARDEEQ